MPESLNHDELSVVWERSRTLLIHPVTVLTSLLDNVEMTWELMQRWRFSNNETRTAKFVATHRDRAKDPTVTIKYFQDLLVDHKPLELVTEVLHYAGHGEMAKQLKQWQIPSCPINGGHLKKVGINPGPQFGRILKELTEKWKESYFTLTEEELIQEALKHAPLK